jgi:hypothetical protein
MIAPLADRMRPATLSDFVGQAVYRRDYGPPSGPVGLAAVPRPCGRVQSVLSVKPLRRILTMPP